MENINQTFLSHPEQETHIFSLKSITIVASILGLLGLGLFISLYSHSLSLTPSSLSLTPPICTQTDPSSCLSSLSNLPAPTVPLLLHHLIHSSLLHINNALSLSKPQKHQPFADCTELLDQARDRLLETRAALRTPSPLSLAEAHTWLSATLTNYITCEDGLNEGKTKLEAKATKAMVVALGECKAMASTSLATISAMRNALGSTEASGYEPMIEVGSTRLPAWVRDIETRLLESKVSEIKADVVVAKDGSGNYKTVSEAVAAAPDKSKKRYVIYVKKGTYEEKVEIGKNKKNLMLVGDGMDFTVITGSLNFIDGTTTFNSATLAAVGEGFIAQDMCFQNTAGPKKHQAVALRVGADKSIINRCRIEGYQDTLYAHSQRQFYRDSVISGTIDFIFGNAAVVLQNCTIIARKPMSNQQNLVTAQGRTDPNQNTGTTIQFSRIQASTDLEPVKNILPTYLGRPWKEYSRTVYMQNNIGDHIAAEGWLPWSGGFALKTLYYAEYMNGGPGAGTSGRVKWPGYHVMTDANEAKKFTVGEFIQGGEWLQATGVAYTEGL
ncbi:hypothetical protein AMTRI_Chr08g166740 [Amborella trichopoda]